MLIKNFLSALVVLTAVGFLSGASVAQAISPAVIAVLDIERVERNSAAWKSLSAQVNAQRQAFQQEVGSLQNQLKTKGQELEGQRTLLSAEVFAQKVKEFQGERAKLQQETKKRKQLLDQVYAKGRQQIRNALNEVIVEYAKTNNIDMVLNRGLTSGVVHYVKVEEFDIGTKVLALLDAKIQTVNLTAQ